MSLAIKQRPDTLEAMQGNEELIKSIETIFKRNKADIPHAWLFTGQSGCGKTTLGRIVANMLGCHEADYKELDAAVFRNIDDVRAIRKNMAFAPSKGKVRVYLLDEVHQLGQGGDSDKNLAQNALLKALEDPPAHVYFILCTTAPNQLIKAIRGRCMPFEVQPLPTTEMVSFLSGIARKERKRISPEVLKQIASDSQGGVRDALQILDKVIDLPADEQVEAAKQQAEKQNQVIELCRALFKQANWNVIAGILEGLEKEEDESIRYAVLNYCASIAKRDKSSKGNDAAAAYLVMDCFQEPFYNKGKAGLVLACYESIKS